MTNKQYEDMVVEKYHKSLEEIMYELCVIRNVVPVEGANILGVPKKTFMQWRTKFRFGPLQMLSDSAVERRKKQIKEYTDQLEFVDLKRPFLFSEEPTLDGFAEILERYLEIYKAKRILEADSFSEMTIIMHIHSLEQILSYVNDYRKGTLRMKIMEEAERILNGLNKTK